MNIIHTTTNNFHFERQTGVKSKSLNHLQTHDFYEVYYLSDGKRKYFLDNTIYTITPGDLIIIPPDVIHRTIEDGENVYSRILMDIPLHYFDQELLKLCKIAPPAYFISIPKSHQPVLNNLLQKLENEYRSKDEHSQYLIKQLINELLIFLIRSTQHHDFSHSAVESGQLINQATRYISENYEKPLSLNEIAKQLGISKSHFCRLFKKKTGANFSDYLTGVRINEAAKMLRATDLSVTEIALRCGYNDSAYFAMIFKKIKNTTPLKYRNSYGP